MGITERKEREKEFRKEAIIDAAQTVFFEKGLLLATMDEIAAAAELSKGTLYLYYKSKEDLYLAVMMRGTRKLQAMLEKSINTKDTALKKILKLSDAYINFAQKMPKYFRMFHFLQTSQFHKNVSDDMRAICIAEHKKLWSIVIDLINKCIEDNVIQKDLDPVQLVIIMWSSATALLLRIDNEKHAWKESMNIDLKKTLELSNHLIISAMLTEKGKKELSKIK